jgi:hypothetical protein
MNLLFQMEVCRKRKRRKTTKDLSDQKKTEALFEAVKAEDLESVKRWISRGADPLDSWYLQFNLLVVLYRRLKYSVNKDIVLEIIEYILNLPQYQKLSVKSKMIYHGVLLYMARDKLYSNFHIALPMLKLILKFKDINQLIFTNYVKLQLIKHEEINVNPAALFVCNVTSGDCCLPDEKTCEILSRLLEIGFSMQESPGCLTVLTVITYRFKYIDQVKILIKRIIELGVNVESSVLRFDQYIQDTTGSKLEWSVPDALLMSFMQKQEDCLVLNILQYWWAPPLALINLYMKWGFLISNNGNWVGWLSKLLTYRGIPHGTRMYISVLTTLRQIRRQVTDANTNINVKDKNIPRKFLQFYASYHQLKGKYFY